MFLVAPGCYLHPFEMSYTKGLVKLANCGKLRDGGLFTNTFGEDLGGFMVDIISGRGGPRREDVPLKQLISQNRGIITQLADQLSGGAYSASKKPRPEPQAEGLIIHVGNSQPTAAETLPIIRVTRNGRVIAMDMNSARQLHHIGEIRRRDGAEIFVLATKANGFIAPVDDTVAECLAEIDGARLDAVYTEETLVADIGARLGIEAR